MTRLSWPDIFTDAAELDFQALLAEWPGVLAGSLAPIGASAFGDLYFQRESCAIERLDVLEGSVQAVADSFDSFQAMMSSQTWQEQNLLTKGIALLIERGVHRSPGQFYGFAPHPALIGHIDWSRVMPLDAPVWNSICSQVLGVRTGPACKD